MPSAPVVPAAFAVGEMVGASGRDVLTAIVAGYEVCCRLGNALDPTSHYARGFHPTATAGTYGAAAAAAKLFGLSKEQIIAAFGVSGSQAAGSLQFLVNGAWNKRYQVGAAAMNGVIAATLARNDFIGATESVEGKHGLLVGYSDNAHPDKAVAGLGKIYETMKIGVKPYPSCRYTHAALDALIAMRREHNLTPDQIKRVEIGLHRNGITLTGDAATKRHPTSIVGGQFSMFFTGAVALDQGRFGWDDYDKARRRRGRCAGGQVRRGAGRSPRNRPHPSVRRARLASPPRTACMSGSMPIPPASRRHFRTRRRCSRNS